MGEQIIKQPNGLYCIWSSVVDDIILINATPEDIINERIEVARQEITRSVIDTVTKLNNGERPYYQFTKTFEEAIECIKDIHGADTESLRLLKEGGNLCP